VPCKVSEEKKHGLRWWRGLVSDRYGFLQVCLLVILPKYFESVLCVLADGNGIKLIASRLYPFLFISHSSLEVFESIAQSWFVHFGGAVNVETRK